MNLRSLFLLGASPFVCACGLSAGGMLFEAPDGSPGASIGEEGGALVEGGAAGPDSTTGDADAGGSTSPTPSPNPPPPNPPPPNPPPPSDAATAPDGHAPPDSGLTSGSIACGTTTCALPSLCCVLADAGASCESSGKACTAAGGALRACDDPSDCTNGNVCCFSLATSAPSSSCQNDCGGGGGSQVEACRAQNDCNGGTCAVHPCSRGGPIQACGPLGNVCP